MIDPLQIFNAWYADELKITNVRIPSACCLSTIGLDGYPNARFVSMKKIVDGAFIITGPLTSRKGLEIQQIKKVSLTFWWTGTERQVRVQGDATEIPASQADKYFAERETSAKIVSLVSEQGKEIESLDELNEKYIEEQVRLGGKTIERPSDWGGYSIKPIRIEFMEFKPTRFHDRKLYELNDGQWILKQLQP